MKKFIALCLSLFLMCALFPAAIAAETTSEETWEGGYVFEPEPDLTNEEIIQMLENDPTTVKSNEYDSILQEKKVAKQVLASQNTTLAEKMEARETLAFDPAEKVYELQEKSDEELRDLCIDNERIQIIRNFKGTDSELLALGATCSVSGHPKYTMNASGQWAKITFTYSWDKAPIWQMRDALVAQATLPFQRIKVPDVTCTINYVSPSGGIYKKSFDQDDIIACPFQDSSTTGFAFKVMEKHTVNLVESTCFAQTGSATLVFRSIDSHDVALSYGYAHAKRNVDASAGITFGPSPTGKIAFSLSDEYYQMLPEPLGGRLCDSYFFVK